MIAFMFLFVGSCCGAFAALLWEKEKPPPEPEPEPELDQPDWSANMDANSSVLSDADSVYVDPQVPTCLPSRSTEGRFVHRHRP